MRHCRRCAHDEERGAVVVEFAVIAMFLATIAFGILEYGYGWRSSMSVLTAARGGARSVSAAGTDYLSDYFALTSVRTNLDSAGLLDGLQAVVVYRAAASDGEPPARCTAGTPQSTDKCNYYTGAQVAAVASGQFNTTTGCMSSNAKSFYCPNTRVTAQGTADYVGVWVQAKAKSVTGFFGGKGFTSSRDAVMRMEPT